MKVGKREAKYQAFKLKTVFDYLVRIKAFVSDGLVCVCVKCGESISDADEGINHLRKHRPKLFSSNSSEARRTYLAKARRAQVKVKVQSNGR